MICVANIYVQSRNQRNIRNPKETEMNTKEISDIRPQKYLIIEYLKRVSDKKQVTSYIRSRTEYEAEANKGLESKHNRDDQSLAGFSEES